MSLLRGVARTAVISGTATAVSNNVSRRQAQRWNQQANTQQQPATQQQPVQLQDDSIEQWQQLAQLKDQGILTEQEFDAKKKQILGL